MAPETTDCYVIMQKYHMRCSIGFDSPGPLASCFSFLALQFDRAVHRLHTLMLKGPVSLQALTGTEAMLLGDGANGVGSWASASCSADMRKLTDDGDMGNAVS